ncbi:MAG: hypothetical protein AB7F86_08795 [Bdellovibrionales bacterium]
MGQSVMQLTQSKYYSTDFNAAIFDGPIRIYFAQHQEPVALHVYHLVQGLMKTSFSELRSSLRQMGTSVFIMLYPTAESFAEIFEEGSQVETVMMGQDVLIAVRGPLEEDGLAEAFQKIETTLQSHPALQVYLEPAAPSA